LCILHSKFEFTMSASYNRVILIGNLCRDPEVKQAPSGTPVCDLRLAVNESYKTQSGELHESVHFVDVTVWDRAATNCQTYLRKGSQVLVEGRLQYDEWKTPQGETRSKLRVPADRVPFLGPRPSTGDVPGGSGAPPNDGYAPAAAAPIATAPTASPPSAAPVASPPPMPPPELTVDTEDLPF